MKPPPAGHPTARAKRGRWYGLATYPRRTGLRIEVSWRGGPESWWLVKARGRHGVFPGHAALEDVMAQVLNEWNGPVDSLRAGREPLVPPSDAPTDPPYPNVIWCTNCAQWGAHATSDHFDDLGDR